MAYNISWKSHPTNKSLYDSLSRVSVVVRQRRSALAGHVSRYDEPAEKLMLWCPDAKRRVGRPKITLKAIIEEERGFMGKRVIGCHGRSMAGFNQSLIKIKSPIMLF